MTKKQRQRKKPQKKISSPLQSKDIQIYVMQQKVEEPQISQPKKKTPKKRQAKKKVTKLQQFQQQLVPQNNVDQIRLSHISSKIQQNFRTQNQSYLLKIKSQYDQYKKLILKYALIVEMTTEPKTLKNYLKSAIMELLFKQIKSSFTLKKQNPIKILPIVDLIKNTSEVTKTSLKNHFINILKKVVQEKYASSANLKLKIMMQQRRIHDQLEKQAEMINQMRDHESVKSTLEDFSSIQLINYQELLYEQQKQEILQNIKTSETKNIEVLSLQIKSDVKVLFKSVKQFVLKPNIKQPFEKFNRIPDKSRGNSKQSFQSNASQYFTPYPSINQREQPQQRQQPKQFQPKYENQYNQNQNQNLISDPRVTPINVKKTLPASNRPVGKTGFLDGYRELEKYNYNNKKIIQPQQFEQPEYEPNDIYQSRITAQDNNRGVDLNRQYVQSDLQFSKFYNPYNNNSVNQSNLQLSKVQSLRASTIDNDWHSEVSNQISPQSRIYPSSQTQQFNWIIFTNEISNLRLTRQINLNNLKLVCIQIDQSFFDDFEYILLSDRFKILILEQKDLVTAEIHMKLGKGDEKGAIQSLINKIRFHMQQFMIQYNTRQVVVLIQYSHKFFLKMLLEYIFPQLGQMQQQYRITPFNQIEELQEIIQELIVNQEQARVDRFYKIPQDLGKFRAKLQNFEFSNLVAMRCLNQLYQNLVQYLLN